MTEIIDLAGLAAYLRVESIATDESAYVILDLANGLVRDVIGETEPTTRVVAITYEVAARAWRNPEGYSSETIDDYTYRRDADTRAAGVYLTDSERAELGGRRSAKVGWLA